jgi:ABC-2 type transport system ATP-binding protein
VLLNSHLLSEVELVCDHVVIVDHGRVVAAGAPDELAAGRSGGRAASGAVSLTAEDPIPLLRELTNWAADRGVGLPGLTVGAPSLEDIYLEVVD